MLCRTSSTNRKSKEQIFWQKVSMVTETIVLLMKYSIQYVFTRKKQQIVQKNISQKHLLFPKLRGRGERALPHNRSLDAGNELHSNSNFNRVYQGQAEKSETSSTSKYFLVRVKYALLKRRFFPLGQGLPVLRVSTNDVGITKHTDTRLSHLVYPVGR